MATSLAAEIENKFGVKPELVEGHGGIYEVDVNGTTVYTNKEMCGQIPENEQVLQEIGRYCDPVPGKDTVENMPEKENVDETESAAPSCGCSSTSAEGPAASDPPGKSWGKTLLFILVILAAVAVGGYSVLKGDSAEISQPEQLSIASAGDQAQRPTTTPVADVAKSVAKTRDAAKQPGGPSDRDKPGQSPPDPNATEEPPTTAAYCGANLDSAEALEKLAADNEVIFVLLPGENDKQARAASRQVEAAVKKLEGRGKRAAAFTLEATARGYDQVLEQFTVESLPCVIVAGQGCGSSAVSGKVTETVLLRAFVEASMPVSSCGTSSCEPQSGSLCCPQ